MSTISSELLFPCRSPIDSVPSDEEPHGQGNIFFLEYALPLPLDLSQDTPLFILALTLSECDDAVVVERGILHSLEAIRAARWFGI